MTTFAIFAESWVVRVGSLTDGTVIKFAGDNPKYALSEHERRWLLDRDVLQVIVNTRHHRIVDHYLTDSRIRLRSMRDSETGEVTYKLTKKYGLGDDYSEPITTIYLAQAEYELFAKLPHRALTKQRYKLAENGVAYSIDVFGEPHHGLILAEIECASQEALLKLPAPSFAVKEVTADERYRGGALSTKT